MSKRHDVKNSIDAARRLIKQCEGFYWFLDGDVRIRNLPDPSIIYPHNYVFDCPLVFAANKLRANARLPLFHPSAWQEPAAYLGMSYDEGYDIMMAYDWDGDLAAHPMWAAMKNAASRFNPDIRAMLCKLL